MHVVATTQVFNGPAPALPAKALLLQESLLYRCWRIWLLKVQPLLTSKVTYRCITCAGVATRRGGRYRKWWLLIQRLHPRVIGYASPVVLFSVSAPPLTCMRLRQHGMLPLASLLSNAGSVERALAVVQPVLAAHRDVVLEKGPNGGSLLHRALADSSLSRRSLQKWVAALVAACPQAVRARDNVRAALGSL